MTKQQENQSAPAQVTHWVLGYGKFGRRAVEALKSTDPASAIVVVEKRPIGRPPQGADLIYADCLDWFAAQFRRGSEVGRIIPSVPLHLAAEWLMRRLRHDGRNVYQPDMPDTLLEKLPNPTRLSPFSAVMSHADFRCPPNCSEPDQLCSYTGRPRPEPLYHILKTMDCGGFFSTVIRSRQFAPGVGGFLAADLWRLLDVVRSMPKTPLLVGTACKCHGVMDTLFHEME